MLRPIAVLTILALTGFSAPAFDLKPGSAFPLIPLPTTHGEKLTGITDFRGKKLMLHLFASW